MVDEKRLAADLLCMRAKKKVEDEENLKRVDIPKLRATLEVDSLYYWILSKVYAEMESYISARNVVTITIIGNITRNNKVLLEHSKSGNYLPHYVEGKEFFEIIKETLKIFDEFEKFKYQYYQDSEETCEFWVSMSTKSN